MKLSQYRLETEGILEIARRRCDRAHRATTFSRATARVTNRSQSHRGGLHRASRRTANRHKAAHSDRIQHYKQYNAEHRSCTTYNTFLEAEPNLRVDATIVS